jgi:hypothetical protein
VDQALTDGRISREIPFIKKAGVEILEKAAAQNVEAKNVGSMLQSHYREQHPEIYESNRKSVDQAAEAIQAIYARNVFPRMKVTWGTYPNHVGHQSYQDKEDYPGCFRCHNGELSSATGETIDQDCSICHTVLAWDEEDPTILTELGLE